LSSGIVVSLYYLLSEEDITGLRIYGSIFLLFTFAVLGILAFVFRVK